MDGARAGVKLHSSACTHSAFVSAFKCVCVCVFANAQVVKSIWEGVFVFRKPCHTEVGGLFRGCV